MGIKVIRKPFHIGSSTAVTLPQGWCNYYRERIATLTILGNQLLILVPKGFESQADKLMQEMEGEDGKHQD
jgi:hypothetical protein